jgi:hypothetical protein
MARPRRQIFRDSAMRQYIQRREQDVLPQIVSPPVFACSWFLLALILMAGLLAWSAKLPTIKSAPGVIVQQKQQARQSSAAKTNGNTMALIFFSPSDASQLHAGQPIQLQITSTGQSINSTITTVGADTISPGDARQRYGLDAGEAQAVTGPSNVVTVNLDTGPSAHIAGSIINAQVQVGTHSVLSELLQSV